MSGSVSVASAPEQSGARRAASIIGLVGAIASVLATGALFYGSQIPGLLSGDAGSIRSFALVTTVVGLIGAILAPSRPMGGGTTLVVAAELTALGLGVNAMTVIPTVLLGIGGLMSVLLSEATVLGRPSRMYGFTVPQLGALLILVMLVTILPTFLYPVFLMKVLCFALFACAFNLLIGYVGLLSFGHAAYFGMGGYVTAWVAKTWGLTPELAILLGGLTGAGLGLVFGLLAIRRQGIYFAMITLALAQMVYFFCLQVPFTGGEDGIQQVPRGRLFGLIPLQSDMAMYWVVAAVFVGFFLLIHRVVHSPFGQVLKAIRENEPRATSLGYRTDDYKLIAFVLSCFITGIAGGTKSLVFGIATLTDVNYAMSGDVVLMNLLGGMGTIFGPVVGATIIQSLEQYLAQFGSWVTVTQGAIFIICVLAFRRGVVGEIAAKLRVGL